MGDAPARIRWLTLATVLMVADVTLFVAAMVYALGEQWRGAFWLLVLSLSVGHWADRAKGRGCG